MTDQEYFNASVRHVMTQGEPAMDTTQELQPCMYIKRGHGGKYLKCGLGGLIPYSQYDKSFEGQGVWQQSDVVPTLDSPINDIIRYKILLATGATLEQAKLAYRLQSAHDTASHLDEPFLCAYVRDIKEAAKDLHLSDEVLSEFPTPTPL